MNDEVNIIEKVLNKDFVRLSDSKEVVSPLKDGYNYTYTQTIDKYCPYDCAVTDIKGDLIYLVEIKNISRTFSNISGRPFIGMESYKYRKLEDLNKVMCPKKGVLYLVKVLDVYYIIKCIPSAPGKLDEKYSFEYIRSSPNTSYFLNRTKRDKRYKCFYLDTCAVAVYNSSDAS